MQNFPNPYKKLVQTKPVPSSPDLSPRDSEDPIIIYNFNKLVKRTPFKKFSPIITSESNMLLRTFSSPKPEIKTPSEPNSPGLGPLNVTPKKLERSETLQMTPRSILKSPYESRFSRRYKQSKSFLKKIGKIGKNGETKVKIVEIQSENQFNRKERRT